MNLYGSFFFNAKVLPIPNRHLSLNYAISPILYLNNVFWIKDSKYPHTHTPWNFFLSSELFFLPSELAVYELEWTGYMLLSSASVKLSADFLLRFLNSKWLIYSHNSCSLSVGSRLSYKATCLASLILLWHWNAENVTHYYKRFCTCNDFIKTRPMGRLDTKEARDHGRRHIWWLPA